MKSIINTSIIIFFSFILLILSNDCKKEDEPGNNKYSGLLDKHTIEIPTADYSHDNINFLPIVNSIGSDKIIGLGEATHGTTEFWGIRQKLTKYLMENKGYKAILLEASFPNMLFIDNYVYNNVGTLSESHAKLGYWKYKEMQELITMIHDYNMSNPENKVHFYGYDCGFTKWTVTSEIVLSYLERVDPNSVNIIASYLGLMNMNNAVSILNFFESKRSEYINLSSREEYRTIYLILKNLPATVIHKELFNSGSNAMQYRDSINLGNFQYITDSLLNSKKVIIWAHNGHVSKGKSYDFDWSMSTMLGLRLKETYGDQYFNICTEFYSGKFWSWDECDGHNRAFIEHVLKAPGPDYYSYYFNISSKSIFFMNFKEMNISAPELNWLTTENRIHVIGGMYCSDKDIGDNYSQKISITDYFDAIFFFKYTNSTTYLPTL